MPKTEHPCKGMPKAQIKAFEQIAINVKPHCSQATLDALLRKGVIIRGTEKRRDKNVVYEVPSFYVPLPIHAQWCEWCDENVKEGVS